jgi:hypothetical protein
MSEVVNVSVQKTGVLGLISNSFVVNQRLTAIEARLVRNALP